ncbi:MAG: hypothetical protein E6R13_00970 [Spirochaetes bacterium]|nr:MAG: hypothetical protein E6R13_00970 [Spirochaetota bacterium]
MEIMKNNLADLLKEQHELLSREILYTENLRKEALKKLEEVNKSIEELTKENDNKYFEHFSKEEEDRIKKLFEQASEYFRENNKEYEVSSNNGIAEPFITSKKKHIKNIISTLERGRQITIKRL